MHPAQPARPARLLAAGPGRPLPPRLPGRRWPALGCALGLLLTPVAGCERGGSSAPGDDQADLGPGSPDCPALTLQVRLLDAWGRPLPGATIAVAGAAAPPLAAADGVALPLVAPEVGGTRQLTLSAPGFVGATVVLTRGEAGSPPPASGTRAEALAEEAGLLAAAAGAAEAPPLWAPFTPALVFSRDDGLVGGERCPVHTLWVGLDHPLYAAGGRPPRAGHTVALHINGEQQWAAAAADLRRTQQRVLISTWWWQSDFELERGPDQPTWTAAERWPLTIGAILDALPAAVLRRVLVARFLGESVEGTGNLNTDSELRTHGRTPDDGWEVQLQSNPTEISFEEELPLQRPVLDFAARILANSGLPAASFLPTSRSTDGGVLRQGLVIDAASYHQKAMAIDGKVGYIGGMNIKSTDWDTDRHPVFEPRRMKYASSVEDRRAVAERTLLPDLGPRQDYFIRFAGPAVADLEQLLCARWEVSRAAGEDFAGASSPCVPQPWAGGTLPGNVTVQVVATMPEPLVERSILESLAKAIDQAERLIYIEDQYFRMPILNERLVAALTRNPELQLVVVTKAVSASDGGKRWTLEGDRLLREAAGPRYHLFQLEAFDAVLQAAVAGGEPRRDVYFQAVDTHSKLVLIDDHYLSIGSCNKNNRGLKFEGELNLVVDDAAFVAAQRQRIFTLLLGAPRAESLSGDVLADVALLDEAARANAGLQQWWDEHAGDSPEELQAELLAHQPEGFLYPLAFDSLMDLPDVGPDVF